MSRFNKIFRSSTTRSLPARKARLSIEALEARDVPSASLINEVLTVRGTTGIDKIELISPQSNQTIVKVNGVEQFNGFDTITKIKVDGRAGTDTVLIRGIQSGVVDGVDIKNSEIVAIGRSAGARGKFSTDAIRSNIFVDQAQFISINNTASAAAEIRLSIVPVSQTRARLNRRRSISSQADGPVANTRCTT